MNRDAPEFRFTSQAHRRYDPLRDTWVLVSPGRTARPWSGQVVSKPTVAAPEYDPDCYLCPGNLRANGERNPKYDSTFVFTNDFAALQPNSPTGEWSSGLLRAQGEAGTCRVVCFSPRHDLDLGTMTATQVRAVVDAWAEQTTALLATHAYVQVFENRGAAMGASNPHPHGQVWAGSVLPVELARERATQRDHAMKAGTRLLSDYEEAERGGERSIVETMSWTVVVPFWAIWPFETLLLPRFPCTRLAETTAVQRDDLCRAMSDLVQAYDRLFGVPFPYSMGWHEAPSDISVKEGWQLHAHFYPPLLRSATVRKFMVGYELLAEPQRDLAPEEAASRLRLTRTADL